MSVFNNLHKVQMELLMAAATGAAYHQWSDEFARKEVREVWLDLQAPLRKPTQYRATIEDLQSLSRDELRCLGFQRWDDGVDEASLYLIPLWVYHYIDDGSELCSVRGVRVVKGTDDINFDQRYGVIAYGFFVKNPKE
jgi:hypothetical protein